jgi:hypothetical protein
MSSSYYLPIPERVWSRVQDKCTYTVPGSNYTTAYIPLTKQTVSQAKANYEEKLLYKGNILQYKANSSCLTKNQRYSKLAKGLGPNRKKVFATQSETYTNPNTTSLLRVNYTTFPFPNQILNAPNNISGPYQYNVTSPFNCSNNTVKDGGNLICGTFENQCTGQIIKTSASRPLCFSSSCSDVPGRPIDLCWNPKVQTWFPKSRYTMSNSGTKWPVGYKAFVSARRPTAPILTLNIISNSTAILSWSNTDNQCIPISSYNIYENGVLILNVSFTVLSTSIDLTSSQNTYFVKAKSTSIESEASNSVTTPFLT